MAMVTLDANEAVASVQGVKLCFLFSIGSTKV